MTVSIQTPFPPIFDLGGLPLDGGYVYIGEANQDAATNPVEVFFDAAMTVSASQPLRTSGGFIVDGSGTPQNIYTAADFSMTVKNRNNVTRYSIASYGTRIFADAITFDSVTISELIAPDTAGGAASGSAALPWSATTTRDLQAKTATVYDQAQPAVAADLAKLTQLGSVLAIVEQTSSTATPAWVNGKNIKTADCTRVSAGVYEIVFSVNLPSAVYFPVGIGITSGVTPAITGRFANRFLVAMSGATDAPFIVVVFGNPAVADPIS